MSQGYWLGWSAGSWGTSWGDIPVDEGWDTAQGIARNLANNLKWEPIHDTEQRLPKFRITSVVKTLHPTGAASVAFVLPRAGITVKPLSGLSANGYAKLRLAPVYTTLLGLTASGDSICPPVSIRGHIRMDGESPTAGGVAPDFAGMTISTLMRSLSARGIRNPTDEELAVIAINLLTKQKSERIRRYGIRP